MNKLRGTHRIAVLETEVPRGRRRRAPAAARQTLLVEVVLVLDRIVVEGVILGDAGERLAPVTGHRGHGAPGGALRHGGRHHRHIEPPNGHGVGP